MEFDGSSKLFQELFDPIIMDGKATPKTYVYVFSKVIDGKTYYKIGEGIRTMSRVTSAQTYLIRFKVEYLIFYQQQEDHSVFFVFLYQVLQVLPQRSQDPLILIQSPHLID